MEKEIMELKEMRAQMSILKEKLDNEVIINDKLMRKTTRSMISSIQSQALSLGILGALSIPFCLWVFIERGFSVVYCIFTAIMLLFCSVVTFIQHSKFSKANPMNSDILKCAQSVKKLKEHYVNWLRIYIPLIIFWFSWTVTEAVIHNSGMEMISFVAGIVIGGTVGAIIGNNLRKRMIRKCEEIIALIEG